MRIGTLWEVEAVEQAVKVLDFAMKMELQARDFYLESLDEV
ncbi:MAG: hypothetical protein PWQ66_1500, partial [Petrotoga sp.]|nr:hypothetical protein [Petrotoga sp.]